VTAELRRRRGWQVNHKRVERLMRTHGIAGIGRAAAARSPSRTSPPRSAPDLLGRLCDPDRLDVAWCG
jgi:putative transposase